MTRTLSNNEGVPLANRHRVRSYPWCCRDLSIARHSVVICTCVSCLQSYHPTTPRFLPDHAPANLVTGYRQCTLFIAVQLYFFLSLNDFLGTTGQQVRRRRWAPTWRDDVPLEATGSREATPAASKRGRKRATVIYSTSESVRLTLSQTDGRRFNRVSMAAPYHVNSESCEPSLVLVCADTI